MCQSAVEGPGPVLTERHLLRRDGGGGFLDLCEKILLLNGKPGGRHNPPQVEFKKKINDVFVSYTSCGGISFIHDV